MRRRSFGWVSALVCVLYLCQAVAVPLYAADAAKGEPVAVGRDVGEPVAQAVEKDSALWPWLVGALVAGLGGWVVGDQLNDDDSATDAETAAAEAEASAAAAEAAAAGGAAAAAAEYEIFIQGIFQATDTGLGNLVAINFSVANEGDHPGGIEDFRVSVGGLWAVEGGRYDQVGKNTVNIKVGDKYYNGVATVVSESQLRLQNGTSLIAQGGASAHIVQMPSE